jgi:hypothetical protein
MGYDMKKFLLTSVMVLSSTCSHAAIFKQEVVPIEDIFDPGSVIIGVYNGESLAEDLHYFKANEKLNIHIDVHSDDIPLLPSSGFKNNTELTEHRAESVKSFLLSNFKDNINNITVTGKGESNPICREDTPECRSKNRRVVIQVYREDRGDIKMNVVPTRKNSNYYVAPKPATKPATKPDPKLGMSKFDVEYYTKLGSPHKKSVTEYTWGRIEYWHYEQYIDGKWKRTMLKFENNILEVISIDDY